MNEQSLPSVQIQNGVIVAVLAPETEEYRFGDIFVIHPKFIHGVLDLLVIHTLPVSLAQIQQYLCEASEFPLPVEQFMHEALGMEVSADLVFWLSHERLPQVISLRITDLQSTKELWTYLMPHIHEEKVCGAVSTLLLQWWRSRTHQR